MTHVNVCAVTGSASGIGAAIRKRLEAEGTRIIGVDVRDAEVLADLASHEGRARAVSEVLERCGGCLDQLVVCAGIGAHSRPPSRVAAVNYFGAVDLLDGLFPALRQAATPAAIAMCSNSAQMAPLDEHPYVLALLAHDEAGAARTIDAESSILAYLGSKHALARAVRRRASSWGRAGVRLNAIAPGPVRTPLLEGDLDDPVTGAAIRKLSIPLGRMGEPDEVAELAAFLLGPKASWIHGGVYYIDGGNDAEIRPDRF
ncbi:MAG TPA: SDR family oxidoreductase [Myxococcota bacterium]|nr:SDR family oxidoreductase [Myxococcota bacterium]